MALSDNFPQITDFFGTPYMMIMTMISRRASCVIADFDEKTSLQAKHFKIGVLCQKRGQFTEEEIFGNDDVSPAFQTFLDLLGDQTQLRGHEGFSGGLDTRHDQVVMMMMIDDFDDNDQTGTHSIYKRVQGLEVMFHVAHLLPFR